MLKKPNKKFYEVKLLKKEMINSNNNSIVWGNFEYVEFSVIDDFLNYNNSKSSNIELIPSSRIYIYDINQFSSLCFSKDTNYFYPCNNISYNFIGITLFNFNNDLLTYKISEMITDSDDLAILKICKYIKENVPVNKCDDFIFETYGALNSHDICIISVFNEIDQMIKYVEMFQKLNYEDVSIFTSSYSVITSSLLIEPENVFNKSNALANIQITYKCNLRLESIVHKVFKTLNLLDGTTLKKEYKNKVKVFSTLGEYDIVIQLPCNLLNNDLYNIILNPHSNFYKKHILQCSTRFSCEKNYKTYTFNKKDLIVNDSVNTSLTEDALTESYNNYQQFCKTSLYVENDCIKEMYEMLWNDYVKAFNISAPNSLWRKDLTTQFNSIIEKSKRAFEAYSKNTIEYEIFDYALELVNVFKQSIYHIKQINSYDLEIIQSLFRNAATYDKMINCYYYIVKNILRYVYLFGNSNQSELIPFINFEAVALIDSDLISGEPDGPQKILSINLPFDTFYNIEKYIPLLYHEIGHYVSPNNRCIRNYYAFIVIMTVVININCNRFYKISDHAESIKKVYENVLKNVSSSLIDDNESVFNCIWTDFYEYIKIVLNDIFKFDLLLKPYEENSEKINTEIKSFISIVKKIKDNVMATLKKDDFYKPATQYKDSFLSEDIWNCVDGVTSGIREATADAFMIEHTDLSLEKYLAYIIFSRLRKGIKSDLSTLSEIRIGIIMDTFINENKNKCFIIADSKQKDIVEIVHKMSPSSNEKEIYRILNEILKEYETYQLTWRPMSNVFNYMIDTIKFNASRKDIDKDDYLSSFYSLLDTLSLDNNIETYLKWINLSFQKLCLDDKPNKAAYSSNCSSNIALLGCSDRIIIDYPTFIINSSSDFNLAIEKVHHCIAEKDDILWYRGQSQVDWDLKPALFRKITNNRYDFLLDAYNEFVAQSVESVELTGTTNTEADWISYMQHYFVPTNFLDWSEQPTTALYFAMENYFDPPCKYLINDPKLSLCTTQLVVDQNPYMQDAAVWVLNPKRMNQLIYKNEFAPIVPNLSITKSLNDNTKRFLFYKDDTITKLYYPMAITTSKISNRIRAQKGHFVAYDLRLPSDKLLTEKNDAMQDIAILQKYYFNNNTDIYKPFLAKIIIKSHIRDEMADYVRHMGVTLSSIYPELMNIGKDIDGLCQNRFKTK